MENDQTGTEAKGGFLYLPGISAGGVLVHRQQIVGARPNGPDLGAIVYTQAGPSIYTAMKTVELADLLGASKVPGRT